ncbi:uncharacterized protein LOC103382329 isoform X3 [Cynoglossus semilaevis]|uniref:uncharacterized protein LOC103382329 isoform X3 n=1 Tax=Cynoglossus semilaevis TaxID=244447 RepID=UPI0004963A92|nr:uncharacterized protein LOC103382329 isoform X3 [Cynoglossus semilaevis]
MESNNFDSPEKTNSIDEKEEEVKDTQILIDVYEKEEEVEDTQILKETPTASVGQTANENGDASEAGSAMPVPAGCLSECSAAALASSASLVPPPPINTQQPGVVTSLLYSGSRFRGHQKSKGNSYDVEVVLQHVTMEDSYLCGYLKIKGLTEEYPTLTTFFAGEIISQKRPFLTRKWDADEDVDCKHWGTTDPNSAAPPPAGAVPGPRSHNQRHQRSVVCWILLHLLPEIYSHHRGLLLPQELRMVPVSKPHPRS